MTRKIIESMNLAVERILAALKQVESRFKLHEQSFIRNLQYVKAILADRYSAYYDYSIASRQLMSLAEDIENFVIKSAASLSDHGKNLALFNASEICVLAADIETELLNRDVKAALAIEHAARILPKNTPGKKITEYNYERRWRLMQHTISELNENAGFFQHAIDAEEKLIDYFSHNTTVEFRERDPSLLTLVSRFRYIDTRNQRIQYLERRAANQNVQNKNDAGDLVSRKVLYRSFLLPKIANLVSYADEEDDCESDFNLLQKTTSFLPNDFLESSASK